MLNNDKLKITRRQAVGGGAALIGWAALAPSPVFAAPKGALPGGNDDIVVTLTGTGSVVPNTVRYGNSTLVQAGGLTLLIDAGRGVATRLNQIGMAMGHIDAFFLTHFHSDQVIGLPDLWMTGYTHTPFGGRHQNMEVYGPVGAVNLCNAMRTAFTDDVRIRQADEKIDDASVAVKGAEFTKDGVFFERNGVKVTSFEVNHGPLIKPACGYRIDYAGKSVVISGDTQFDQNLIKHAMGADVIIHEVAIASEKVAEDDKPVLAHHTLPEQVGTVFATAKPRLGVFSHLVNLLPSQSDAEGVSEILRRTRKNFAGKIMVGDDLTRIVISKADVKVQKYNEAKNSYAG